MLPFLAIIVGVLYAMYGGIATPSETAAVGALLCLVIAMVIYKLWTPAALWVVLRDSTKESVMILFIIAAAGVFSYMLSSLFITQSIAEWIGTLDVNRWVLMGIINLFLLVAGFFLPPVAVILMAAPILLPIITTAGFDPIWFAVILTINMEIGLISPPVGLNLYVINGIAPDISLKTILKGSLPFVACMVAGHRDPVRVSGHRHMAAGRDDGDRDMSLLADLLSTLIERRAAVGAGADDRPIEELCAEIAGQPGRGVGLCAGGRDPGPVRGVRRRGQAGVLSVPEHRDGYRSGHRRDCACRLSGDARPGHTIAPSWPPPSRARQELARRLNQVPGATARLVAMRADLLRLIAQDASLAKLDLDFRHLLSSWFNRGFLVLRPITWSSPASILEKIISYEAVHAIDSWDDLRRRVQPADRRCFAFFHPAMPDEPLIFVEVALTRGIPGSIQDMLAGRPRGSVPGAGRHRDVLFDLELSGGAGGHLLWQFADQAGGRGPEPCAAAA